ncbi:MAG: SoxR reducing system RseC family protein [Pseudomonadales bacterium]
MIETGRVVAIAGDAVYVETNQKSACGGCSAQKGCGQTLLASIFPERRDQLLVSTAHCLTHKPALHDTISFTVPDNALLSGAARVYLLPLLGMLLFAVLAHLIALPEWGVISLSFSGLAAGAYIASVSMSSTSQNRLLPTFYKIVK